MHSKRTKAATIKKKRESEWHAAPIRTISLESNIYALTLKVRATFHFKNRYGQLFVLVLTLQQINTISHSLSKQSSIGFIFFCQRCDANGFIICKLMVCFIRHANASKSVRKCVDFMAINCFSFGVFFWLWWKWMKQVDSFSLVREKIRWINCAIYTHHKITLFRLTITQVPATELKMVREMKQKKMKSSFVWRTRHSADWRNTVHGTNAVVLWQNIY